MAKVYSVNGVFIKAQDAQIHVSDLTLRRGYGAFDFFRVVRGQALFIDDHLERLEHSSSILGLELPLTKDQLKAHLLELIAKNETLEAGVQIFLTGGYAADGFTPTQPNLLILDLPMPKHDPKLYEQGTKLISYQYQRDLPEVKSTNYLMAVYLRTAMRQAAASDVLYHDGSFALETSRSNLFVVTQKGTLITPRERILKGITRKHLLKVATELMPVEERELGLEEVWQAQEVFISSTTKGAMPVRQIDDYIIADGKPGPITRLLRETFETYLCDYLARAQPLASS